MENRGTSDIEVFFKPRSIAVVGASPTPGRLGYVVIQRLLNRYKRERIYPVNPKYGEVLGLKCYRSVEEIPEPLDLAVILVPAPMVPGVVEACVRKGVRGIIIISGGFAETGPEGARLEERVREAIRGTGTRVIGPNCIGVLDLHGGMDTFFLPEEKMMRPPPGEIAIISQSGALLSAMLDWAAHMGIGVSKAVSYGNKVDVDDVDMLQYLAQDPETRVIVVYVEGLKPGRGKAFIETVRRVVREKPVIVLKGGRTARGAVAAISHTAALAGSYKVFRAALRQAGAIEAADVVDVFDLAKALTMQPPARGNRVAVITNAGGPGVMATDALESLGLRVPLFSEELQARLREMFPPFYSVKNPVDVTGGGSNEDYRRAIEVVVRSGEVDALLVVALIHPPGFDAGLADIIANTTRGTGLPVVAMSFGGGETSVLRRKLEKSGIPVYETVERAARALWALYRYGRVLGVAR